MINWLKQKIYQSYLAKKKNIKFSANVEINRDTNFEGHNSINRNIKLNGSHIGLGTYIAANSILRRTKIGRFCAIGDNVRTGLGIHPTKGFVSIHPAFFSLAKQAGFSFADEQCFEEHKYVDAEKKYYIEIGSDVWIGNNVMIMDGVTVGNGAVIAAGAVVSKDVEPFSIVGGIPAKHIRYRFNENQRQTILNDPWWERPFEWLKANADKFKSFYQLYS